MRFADKYVEIEQVDLGKSLAVVIRFPTTKAEITLTRDEFRALCEACSKLF